jgi:hypothetical protein
MAVVGEFVSPPPETVDAVRDNGGYAVGRVEAVMQATRLAEITLC